MTLTRRGLLHRAAAGVVAGRVAHAADPPLKTDVCIYGASPGGIATAVAAARLGRNVVLAAHEDHIGGIVSNGLTNADIGKRQAVGGLFYEFTQRVVRHYEALDRNNPDQPNVKLCRDGYWYEPSAAERIFHEMIEGEGGRIRLLLSHELKKASVRRNRLVSLAFASSAQGSSAINVEAKVFVDATYEGDLAAASGAPFRTGRESRSEYNEPHAGRIYMKFRGSELLPGSTGEADDTTQAYCFRFHVTNDPAKRVPIEKPAGYNRRDYDFLLQDVRAGLITKFRQAVQVYPMPNGRFELNSDHINPETGIPKESLDLAEECWEWPTANLARRREIYNRYRTHNVGLIWTLQNDPEIPDNLRNDARQYGWHRDEWAENSHVPRQVYVRQGRRIVGDYILTERDADVEPALERTRIRPDSIAVIEWAFDPHAHHRYDPAHPGVREGYIYIDHEPFQVPYGVLVPRKVDGLLVPVACSCSHVAYNALRMEPVFMALGEACGIAAHLAIERDVPLRKVPVPDLQSILTERKGVIAFFEDLDRNHPSFAAQQWLGARGLNKGYRIEAGKALDREQGWDAMKRVLAAEGRKWEPPQTDRSGPLIYGEVAAQLKLLGLNAHEDRRSFPSEQQLTMEQLAQLLFSAMAPKARTPAV